MYSDEELLSNSQSFLVSEHRAKEILRSVHETAALRKPFPETLQKIQAHFFGPEREYAMFIFAIMWIQNEKPH